MAANDPRPPSFHNGFTSTSSLSATLAHASETPSSQQMMVDDPIARLLLVLVFVPSHAARWLAFGHCPRIGPPGLVAALVASQPTVPPGRLPGRIWRSPKHQRLTTGCDKGTSTPASWPAWHGSVSPRSGGRIRLRSLVCVSRDRTTRSHCVLYTRAPKRHQECQFGELIQAFTTVQAALTPCHLPMEGFAHEQSS